jgi:hypothetical protein
MADDEKGVEKGERTLKWISLLWCCGNNFSQFSLKLKGGRTTQKQLNA